MIGTDLDLDLPDLGDSLATIVSKTVVALSAIEDSHADLATPSALDINSNISFGGNHATNVGGVVLAAGNSPTAAGSFYYSGGKFYLKDATGVIQLSADGTINVSSSGGIGGDYGQGGNPAVVTYDDASGQYRFKESTGPDVWADLVVDDVVLMETSGTDSIRLSAPADVTTSYTLTLPAALAATSGPLRVDATGQVSLGAQTHNRNISPAGWQTTPSAWRIQAGAGNGPIYWEPAALSSAAETLMAPVDLEVGQTITDFRVNVRKNSSDDANLIITLVKIDETTGVITTVRAVATNANAPGTDSTLTPAAFTETIAAGYSYAFITDYGFVTGPDPSAKDRIYSIKLTYTDPH